MKKKILIILWILTALLYHFLPGIGADNTRRKFSVASGVVPHHMLAKEIMVDFFKFVAEQEQHPETIVLLSPDHFNSALLDGDSSFITVNWEKGQKNIYDIPIDVSLLKKLTVNHEIKQNHGAILADFGITNLLPLIREYIPEAKIVPLLMPADISRNQVEILVKNIHKISSLHTMMIASVDFSHYLPLEAAYFHDMKSIRVLLNFEEKNFENIEVDCWHCLYAARLFAQLRGKESPLIMKHKNSAHFLPLDLDRTTSYFSVVFRDENLSKSFTRDEPPLNGSDQYQEYNTETILLAGDMMLDRGIAKLIIQNSVYYPFQKINQFLRGTDIVFANLEGPILENSPELEDRSLSFSFHKRVLEGIKRSNINLLSLANNHTTDLGKEGLEETISWLERNRIHFVGNPLSSYDNITPFSFSTNRVIFLAFNRILPFVHSWEDIHKRITETKQNNPGKFLIVSMHWGKEYQTTSSPTQRELAHQIIADGADLIVGHHPHVVQEIEFFQGKLIFYSLGNFIFDHQFSPETRKGLTVGLAVHSDKVSFRLFPIQTKAGQPMLSSHAEVKEFLKNLAQRSDKRLWNCIEKGIIEIPRSMKQISANHEEE